MEWVRKRGQTNDSPAKPADGSVGNDRGRRTIQKAKPSEYVGRHELSETGSSTGLAGLSRVRRQVRTPWSRQDFRQ